MTARSAQRPVHTDLTLGSTVWLSALPCDLQFLHGYTSMSAEHPTTDPSYLPFCFPESF